MVWRMECEEIKGEISFLLERRTEMGESIERVMGCVYSNRLHTYVLTETIQQGRN